MELMEIRRRLMMGMASGATIYHGTFTPESDLTEYVIDVGKQVHTIIVQVVNGVRVSGSRNFGYAIMFEDADGNVYEYGTASNATGTSWTVIYWSLTSEGLMPITKSGTRYTVYPGRVGSNTYFMSGIDYEWYAY